ncbi:hypothetical protein Tco_1140056 [Tanacetum coccineum]
MVRLWWPQPARPPPQRWRQAVERSEAPRGVAPPQPDTTWCGCGGCTVVRPPPRWWFGGGQRRSGGDSGVVAAAAAVDGGGGHDDGGGVERLPAAVEDGSEGGGVMKVDVLAEKGRRKNSRNRHGGAGYFGEREKGDNGGLVVKILAGEDRGSPEKISGGGAGQWRLERMDAS